MAETCDFFVIGSGIAGLSFALEAADFGEVTLVTKREASEANTQLRPGRHRGVLGEEDSFEAHVHDTLVAGAGLCARASSVEICVEEGPDRIRAARRRGVALRPGRRRRREGFDLGREGGHSRAASRTPAT
jgi:L-aspartate oxidase